MRARIKLSIALAVVGAVVACDFSGPPTGPGTPPLARLLVIPDSVMLDPQQTQRFQALGLTPAGDTVSAMVNWQVSGGSITASGTYTADTSLSDVTVTATVKGTQLAGAGQVKKRRLVQVVVTPATVSLQSGSSQQFAAYGRRNTGDSVPVSVSFSATGGTITSNGMYNAGAAPGTYRVSARESTLGLTDTVAVSVTAAPPPPGGWPNEPAGLSLVTDEPFNALVDGGWRATQRQGTNGSGLFAGLDATAPISPAGVLQFTFATGFVAGSEPGVEYYDLATAAKETYFAFWWKPSSPWQNNSNSNVNKIAFLFPSAGDMYIMMQGTGSGYQLAVEPEFPGDVRVMAPNVTATPVALGQWHLVEWYVKYATSGSSGDGVTKWWMDGVLQGSYTDLQTPGDAGFTEYQLAPTWGGVVGTKSETDFYMIDHARISRR